MQWLFFNNICFEVIRAGVTRLCIFTKPCLMFHLVHMWPDFFISYFNRGATSAKAVDDLLAQLIAANSCLWFKEYRLMKGIIK